jgi:predicted negative regulator of RcsB-dependent stress response
VRKNDVKEIRLLGKQVMDGFGSTAYGPPAALLLAKTNYENGDPAIAAGQLQWAIDNAKDAETAELARLRLASIRLEEKKYEEALRLLETRHSSALETLYADLRGDIMVAQGQLGEARAAYKRALEKSLPNSSYRSVVQIKLDALGGDK